MHPRTLGLAAHRWTSLLLRRRGAQAVDMRTLGLVYAAWIGAFALKHIGASWDVAWHFRFLRDDFAPPHLVNTVGMLGATMLLIWQTRTEFAVERKGLRLIQAGVLIFAVAVPLDVINHRLFGLDITAWSPTHFLLYAGTTVMLAGVLRCWLKLARPGPLRALYTLGFLAFLLDDVLFPLEQQEYGTLALDAYLKRRSTASADLLALAGPNVTKFALSSIPAWLYPLWLILGCTLVFVIAQYVGKSRWAATVVASIYLVYRFAGWAILTTASFPPSFIPVMLLGGAVLIDLQARLHWRPLVLSGLVLAAFYGTALVIGRFTIMPAFPVAAAPAIGILLWIELSIVARYRDRRPGPQPHA